MKHQQVEDEVLKFLDLYSNVKTPFVVALSGGMDSVVLLHALKQNTSQIQAIHIHHGLQEDADSWASFCQQLCEQWQIKFQSCRITIDSKQRKGLEAKAREQRYEALYQSMGFAEILLTAHHQRDQVETGLLNFVRGSGISGLAAMPYEKAWGEKKHIRPLLEVPYDALKAYASKFQLRWVEDPSNYDFQYRRNLIRHEIMPKIYQAWSDVDVRMGGTIRHLQESLGLLNQLAEMDLSSCRFNYFMLDLTSLKSLSEDRVKNVLRYWAEQHDFSLNQKIYQWFLLCWQNSNTMAKPEMRLPNQVILKYDHDRFYVLSNFKEEFNVKFQLFDANSLHFSETELMGHQIKSTWFESDVRVRSIEAEDVGLLGVEKALKKWFKQHHIPVWDRRRWPVVEINGQVAAILGFKTLERFQ